MSNELMTVDELEVAQCSYLVDTEKHGPLFFHGRCHIGAGNEVEYFDGLLTIRCN